MGTLNEGEEHSFILHTWALQMEGEILPLFTFGTQNGWVGGNTLLVSAFTLYSWAL